MNWIGIEEYKPKPNTPVFAKLSCGKKVLAAIVEGGDEDIYFDWAQMMNCGDITDINSYELDAPLDVVMWQPMPMLYD